MGKFLEKFKKGTEKTEKIIEKIEKAQEKSKKNKKQVGEDIWGTDDFLGDALEEDKKNSVPGDPFGFEESPINNSQSQKPESFHRYILENQYKDLEMSIRGVMEIWNKKEQKFIMVKKKIHCFTDEEAENILRTVQSHLSSDIKLSLIPKQTFGAYMIGLFEQFQLMFRAIAEYNYGRYGSYESQYKMKSQNLKIFIELWTRIQANYSRAIAGMENRSTHDNIKGQESLNNSGQNSFSTRYF